MPSQKLEAIINYLPISGTLGSGGQPAPEQFAELRAAGYEVIINLAMPDSTNALPNEAALATAQGMTYIHIPVVWKSPTQQDLERFFAVMDAHRGRQIFVHCAMNMRASAFIYLYRLLRLNVPQEQALTTMQTIWDPNPTWQHFIDRMLEFQWT